MDDSSPPTPELPERKNRFSSNSGIKRNKVSRACDECRKRKVRCDGAQPCARCQKSSTECIFSNVTPKRGPPKQYLEPFEARLKTIDTVLKVLELTTTTNDTKISNANNNWERKGPIIETNNPLDISSIGHALYTPDFPARLDRIEALYKNNLKNNVETQQQQDEELPIITANISTATNEIRIDLIQAYFEHIHPSIPFLHGSAFSQQLKPPSVLLLNAVYAVSSKYVKTKHKKKQEEVEEGEAPGWSYYKMALSLIDTYADMPRLSTIQALLLLAKYNEHIYKNGFLWRTKFFIQLAVKMSTDLGLSKEPPVGSSTCNYELEMKRRTFWAVYTYEVLMSAEQGLELYLKQKECAVKYPHVLSDESSKEDSNAVLNFYWTSKVIHTQAAVLEFMRAKYGDNNTTNIENEEQEFLILDQNLRNLETSIPPMIEGEGEASSIHTCFIHLEYHLATILLYRPYALATDNQHHSGFISHCLSSASTITQIVEQRLNSGGLDSFYTVMRGNQQIIYCLTAAITVQRALRHVSDRTNEMYQRTRSILQTLIRHSPVTELETSTAATAPESAQQHHHHQQQQHLLESRPELQIVSPSNTSSTRSSPLIPTLSSPHSPNFPAPTIRKRHSRSSLQFPTTSTTSDMNYVMQSSSSYVPEYINHHRMRPAANRSPYANNRLSAPVLGTMYQQSPYFHQMQQQQQQQNQQQQQQYQQQQQQQQQQQRQQMHSYSQPSSPTTSQFGGDYIGSNAGGSVGGSSFPVAPHRTTSLSRKTGSRRSASSIGEFIVPSQQRTNRATPYINPRRHTLTNTTPPDLSNVLMVGAPSTTSSSSSSSVVVPPSSRHLHAMAVRNQNRYSQPVMNNTQPYMIPITQQQQQYHQQSMMFDPSFPMDPVIPDSPNESMMGLLLNPWDFTTQPPPPP